MARKGHHRKVLGRGPKHVSPTEREIHAALERMAEHDMNREASGSQGDEPEHES